MCTRRQIPISFRLVGRDQRVIAHVRASRPREVDMPSSNATNTKTDIKTRLRETKTAVREIVVATAGAGMTVHVSTSRSHIYGTAGAHEAAPTTTAVGEHEIRFLVTYC